MTTLETGWNNMDDCPRDREVTLWATHLPLEEGYQAVRGYFHEPIGQWVACGNDGSNFTVLHPTGWLDA
jgi:hypothetical protein